MHLSSRRFAIVNCAYRAFLCSILSLLLLPGPDGLLQEAQARGLSLPAIDQAGVSGASRGAISGALNREALPPSATTTAMAMAAPVPAVQVQLTASTTPSQGQAGVNLIYVTGTGFPAGTISPASVTVSFATSCGGAVLASVNPSAIQNLYGTTRRAQVLIPGTLAATTYYLSLSGSTSSGTEFASSTCSTVQVTGCRTGFKTGVQHAAGERDGGKCNR